jgi:hypothetical protein
MYSFDEQTNNLLTFLIIICYGFKGRVLSLNYDR